MQGTPTKIAIVMATVFGLDYLQAPTRWVAVSTIVLAIVGAASYARDLRRRELRVQPMSQQARPGPPASA